ncbi:MAG: Crp/Fnr family transcriptional regulator [Saprospiraceae bacterium]|nr:Crp/Fnr family transcriptional regulator [Saprospiraceae bacterium]
MQPSSPELIIAPFLFKHHSVLENLPPTENEALLEHSERKSFSSGEVLFKQGQFPKGAYLLLSGIVRIDATSQQGQRQVIYFYAPGDWMGYRQLLNNQPLPIEANAIGHVDTLFIPAPAFEELLRSQRYFARNLLEALSFEFTVWINRLTTFTKLSVRERLAICLLILRDRFSYLNPPIKYLICSRADLADFIGATNETTVRTLSSFRDNGWLTSRGKKITILDPDALASQVGSVSKD